jgi:hypothetical protein
MSTDQDAKRVGIVSGIGWRKLPASLDAPLVLKKKEGDYRDATTFLKLILIGTSPAAIGRSR